MARIRTIKPTHWDDRELPNISLQAHLVWIATWNFSDDDGVFEADPIFIKSKVFPRRTDIRAEQIKAWLDQLVKARFLIPFQYNGNEFYISRTFSTHQRIDKPQPGIIPSEVLQQVFQEHSRNVPGTLLPVKESIVEEGSGGVEGGEPPAPTLEEIEFKEVLAWMKENCPRVLQMREPLTQDEYFRLKATYEPELIPKILLAMHNWSKLTKDRVNAYLTFKNFIKRELENKRA